MVLSILQVELPRYLSPWQGSCYWVLCRGIFWFFWDSLFYFFLSFKLVWWCQFPIYPNICRFLFLRVFWRLFGLVMCRDVVQKTCLRWWTIGKSGERGSGISVLPARHGKIRRCVVCHFSLLVWRIFLCQTPFLYLDCIFSLFVLGFPIFFLF